MFALKLSAFSLAYMVREKALQFQNKHTFELHRVILILSQLQKWLEHSVFHWSVSVFSWSVEDFIWPCKNYHSTENGGEPGKKEHSLILLSIFGEYKRLVEKERIRVLQYSEKDKKSLFETVYRRLTITFRCLLGGMHFL